jgi:hypothetical protein
MQNANKIAARIVRGAERAAKQQQVRRETKERLENNARDNRKTTVVAPRLDVLEGGHA